MTWTMPLWTSEHMPIVLADCYECVLKWQIYGWGVTHLYLNDMGMVYRNAWIWNIHKKKILKCSNISVKKYQNSPMLGVWSGTHKLYRTFNLIVISIVPWSYMKPYTADMKSHDPVMMNDDIINRPLHMANQETWLINLMKPWSCKQYTAMVQLQS